MRLPLKYHPLVWLIHKRLPCFTRKNGRIGTASDSLNILRENTIFIIVLPVSTINVKPQNRRVFFA